MTPASLPARSFARLRELPEYVRARFTALPLAARVTTVFVGVMLLGGLYLRITDFAAPPWFTFDEELFVKNAHAYLMGTKDVNDHPPLGKILQAIGILGLGYNSAGWRFIPLVFGFHSLVVAYYLGKSLFESERAGVFAAAFVAADGFFISYSRAGLLDGILVCFMLWSMLLIVSARSPLGILLGTLFLGLTTSVKWSGGLTIIPAAAAIVLLGRVHWANVFWLQLVPVIHVVVWLAGLRITGEPHDLTALWKLVQELFHHHLEMTKHQNGLASPWYSWPVMYHPIVTKLSHYGMMQRYSTSLSNLVFAFVGLAFLPTLGLFAAVLRVWGWAQAKLAGWFPRTLTNGVLVAVIGWAGMISPWTVARKGYVFHYHYLPSFGFLLLLLAGVFAYLERKSPLATAIFVGLALGMSLYFAPAWGELPLRDGAAHARLWFATWRP